jgi:hypothetical protein
MKYGDFSSVVQLGVGLHIGSALLQIYGDLGLAPLVRTIDRTRALFLVPEDERPPELMEAELKQIEGRYEIFKVQFFQEFRKYVVISSLVAVILAIVLVVIAYKAQDEVRSYYVWSLVAIWSLSLLPGPLSLARLWLEANRQVKPLRDDADDLEQRALRAAGQPTDPTSAVKAAAPRE